MTPTIISGSGQQLGDSNQIILLHCHWWQSPAPVVLDCCWQLSRLPQLVTRIKYEYCQERAVLCVGRENDYKSITVNCWPWSHHSLLICLWLPGVRTETIRRQMVTEQLLGWGGWPGVTSAPQVTLLLWYVGGCQLCVRPDMPAPRHNIAIVMSPYVTSGLLSRFADTCVTLLFFQVNSNVTSSSDSPVKMMRQEQFVK